MGYSMRRHKPRTVKKRRQGGGPPSSYLSEYHPDRAIKLGKMGKSFAQIAANFGISRSQLQVWEEKYPEFRAAMEVAHDASLAWWEDQGQAGMWAGSNFNNGAFSLQIRSRFREEYGEVKTINANVTHEDALDLLGDDEDDE